MKLTPDDLERLVYRTTESKTGANVNVDGGPGRLPDRYRFDKIGIIRRKTLNGLSLLFSISYPYTPIYTAKVQVRDLMSDKR